MLKRIKGLESALKQRIIGQDHAIETLVQIFSLRIRRLDLRPECPNGVLLFIGPTGVGKTETARVLAEYFFGSADWLVQKGDNERYGARELERTVERELMMLLAPHVPAMLDTLGAIERTFRITLQGDRLAVEG
ncbi:MAG: hypothetical protein C4336_01145 [Armatimonadota bacterium]